MTCSTHEDGQGVSLVSTLDSPTQQNSPTDERVYPHIASQSPYEAVTSISTRKFRLVDVQSRQPNTAHDTHTCLQLYYVNRRHRWRAWGRQHQGDTGNRTSALAPEATHLLVQTCFATPRSRFSTNYPTDGVGQLGMPGANTMIATGGLCARPRDHIKPDRITILDDQANSRPSYELVQISFLEMFLLVCQQVSLDETREQQGSSVPGSI